MGLRDIERKIRSKSSYQRKEAEILLDELDRMIDDLDDLKGQLKKFEKEHKEEIETNKEYYQKVTKIREELGLPQELGVYKWKESASLKDRITGGGYFDQLANELLELGKKLISNTGGMIAVAEIVLKVNRERPGKIVSATDVVKALKKLEEADLIQPLRKLPSGVLIAEFIAIELSDDQQRVLDIASRRDFLTREELLMETEWSTERISRNLEELERNGLVIKEESVHEGIKYWFPGLGQQG